MAQQLILAPPHSARMARAKRILGLSKLARLVEHFAAQPQTQERLTKRVADCLQERVRPRGTGVLLDAEHACMTLRGVRSTGATTVTLCAARQPQVRPAVADRVLRPCWSAHLRRDSTHDQ
jgi:GTP cyclohydrolase I